MRIARPASPIVRHRRRHAPTLEPLEDRRLFAVTIMIDYSLDTNNFFGTAERRATLQAAADAIAGRFGDELEAIVPSPGNTWTVEIFHPATDAPVFKTDLTIPANTIRVFAGGRNQPPGVLGVGGPAQETTANGTAAWVDTVLNRGQGVTEGPGATDFGSATGTISFDTDPFGGWHFGLDEADTGAGTDFYSVASHEMAHLLGFGTSDSWDHFISSGVFTGPASVAEYDGSGNVPLSADEGHWASFVDDGGAETAMDPEISSGRKAFTALDFAGLDDLGWELPLSATLNPVATTNDSGAASKTFTVTYSHYTNIAGSSIGNNDVTVSGPNGFSAPGAVLGTTGSGRSITATYSIQAPGGSFDSADSGLYSVTLAGGAVGDAFGNSTKAASLGSFAIDIDPPTATLAATDVTLVGGASHAFAVTYADPAGIAASSIDAADVTVTRASDGLALTVLNVQVAPAGDDPTMRTATYTVAAPGGMWEGSDGGTYNVVLNANQVSDATGTPADGGTLGSFDVSINAVAFSSGADLHFTDASGDPVTISMKGPGSGEVIFPNAGNADAGQIVLNNVAVSSSLTITAGGAGTAIGDLTVNGSLKSLTGKNTDLAGAMTVAGSLPKIAFRNAGGSMTLNGAGAAVTITLAQAHDLSITSAAAIKSIKANDWLDTDATPDLITTSALSALAVKGAMQAGVAAGTIGKVTVGGALSGAEIRSASAIAGITVGSVAGSMIYAGVKDDVSDLPDSADDFANVASTLTGFTVKSKAPGSFSNTRIAAGNIGKLALGVIATGNGGSPFGVTALAIKSGTAVTDSTGPLKASKLDDPAGSRVVGDFAIRLL